MDPEELLLKELHRHCKETSERLSCKPSRRQLTRARYGDACHAAKATHWPTQGPADGHLHCQSHGNLLHFTLSCETEACIICLLSQGGNPGQRSQSEAPLMACRLRCCCGLRSMTLQPTRCLLAMEEQTPLCSMSSAGQRTPA